MGCFGPLHVEASTTDLSFDGANSLFTSGAMSVFVAGSFFPDSFFPNPAFIAKAITCFDSIPGSGPLSNCYPM